MPVSSTFAKKTKSEILAEYEQLLSQLEELKYASKLTHQPESLRTVDAARENTAEAISQSIAEIKKTVAANLEGLSAKLNDSLSTLLNNILNEAKKFNELQQAIELSRSNLKTHYNIEVAAETIENLVNDYEAKRKQLENDFMSEKQKTQTEIDGIKRAWTREQEEYEYDNKLKQKREESLYQETRAKKDKELAEREQNIKLEEQEMSQLKKQVEQIPDVLAKEVAAKEKEAVKQLEHEQAIKIEGLKKDWEAAKRLEEMKLQTALDQVKKQDAEIAALKKEAELANKKAQELAVKIVESGSRMKSHEEAAAGGQKMN